LKISVITIAFNSEKYITECIKSIKQQTYKNFEHIILDCGSSDNTLQKIKSQQYKNLKLITYKKCGLSEARNYAINKSKGDIIAILDSDDISTKKRLAKTKEIFKKNKKLALLGAEIKTFGARKNWKIQNLEEKHLKFLLNSGITPFAHSTTAFTRKAYVRGRGYSSCARKCEDFDLFLKISQNGEIKKTPEVFGLKRIHDQSHSFQKNPQLENFYILQSLNSIRKQKWKISKKNFKSIFIKNFCFQVFSFRKNISLSFAFFLIRCIYFKIKMYFSSVKL